LQTLEARARLAKETGLTLADLAHWSNMPARQLSRWAAGETELSPDEWDRVLVVLTVAIGNRRRMIHAAAYDPGALSA